VDDTSFFLQAASLYELESLLRMTRAPITPGIHPAAVRIVTMMNEPQPLSTTASGGKIIDSNTLNSDIVHLLSLTSLIHSFPHQSANPVPINNSTTFCASESAKISKN